MKKLIAIVLSIVMLISLLSLAGCSKAEPLKIGLGIVASYGEKANAKDDTNGKVDFSSTYAAVLLDSEGKIVKCAIDSGDATLSFNSKGENVAVSEFKTKYELGNNYNMVAYGGAKKEWFEQVDAFTNLVKGKTLQDVKALAATDGKGNDEVVNAGCTIIIADFIKALEKAVNNAVESNAIGENSIQLGVVATNSGQKATAEAIGSNTMDITVSAAAIDENSKVTAIKTDSFTAAAQFDAKGKFSENASTTIATKIELGDNYGMKTYGQDLNGDGKVLEWFEQAAAFDAACVGKNADEIAALANDKGYGVDAVQTAGCTINISDIVKAATKAAK